jgi:BolA protein
MTVQATIEQKLAESLTPAHLEVINESYMHNVPPGSESHFKVVIVADVFDGVSRVRRHQQVNGILAKEIKNDIHALSMQTMTRDEWTARGGRVMKSPECLGGSKHDK